MNIENGRSIDNRVNEIYSIVSFTLISMGVASM